MKCSLNLLILQNAPILEQLQIEEALLRVGAGNWCIINNGSLPSIVMGISGKPEEVVDLQKYTARPIPFIKRYSGGGTVVVDENTLFVSFILQKKDCSFSCFPEPILRWSGNFYKTALAIPGFDLKENDYTIGDLKCGGNAQYIKKNRFVHHTTFLWDFEDRYMSYLLHPKKIPSYRKGREHGKFLCCLKDFLICKEDFITQILAGLSKDFQVLKQTISSIEPLLLLPHRKTTTNFYSST